MNRSRIVTGDGGRGTRLPLILLLFGTLITLMMLATLTFAQVPADLQSKAATIDRSIRRYGRSKGSLSESGVTATYTAYFDGKVLKLALEQIRSAGGTALNRYYYDENKVFCVQQVEQRKIAATRKKKARTDSVVIVIWYDGTGKAVHHSKTVNRRTATLTDDEVTGAMDEATAIADDAAPPA